MKNTQISGLIFLFAISTSAMSAGVITFTGQIVTGTCEAKVGKNGSLVNANATIALPTVHSSVFEEIGDTAGRIGFQIALTGDGCTGSNPISTATPYFSYETAKVNNAGRVINTDPDTKNTVEIQILNHASSPINLTENHNDQLLSENSSLTYQYYAEYYATADSVAAGPVNGSLTYNVFYK